MRRFSFVITSLTLVLTMCIGTVFAGNEQRAGQAGAPELLINPWARSSGMGGANTASVQGLEAIYLNVAGTAFINKTDLMFSHNQYLVGTGIGIYAFGFAQKVGEAGVLSLGVMSLDAGKIDITTVNVPEGGLGTFHPQFTTISASYAREFSNSIYGGATIKIVSGGISDLKASGVAIDAGIQYVTGLGVNKLGDKNRDNLRFGITMKNVGPEMKYTGDGMSFRAESPAGIIMTNEYRSATYELPSLIKIGFAYDLKLAPKVDSTNDEITCDHILSAAANFTSNSFTKDQFHFGLEYKFKSILMLRGGYIYEAGITGEEKDTWYTGPTGGVSLEFPLSKVTGTRMSIDYSYRATTNFDGIHAIGIRVSL